MATVVLAAVVVAAVVVSAVVVATVVVATVLVAAEEVATAVVAAQVAHLRSSALARCSCPWWAVAVVVLVVPVSAGWEFPASTSMLVIVARW